MALANPGNMQLHVDATRIVDPQIGAAFASRSLDLELVNAEDFFHASLRTWTWPAYLGALEWHMGKCLCIYIPCGQRLCTHYLARYVGSRAKPLCGKGMAARCL